MKHFLLRAFKLLLAVLFPGLLFAQTSPDFNLLLHSGKFVPRENLEGFNKNSDVFQNSLFHGKHYVTLQFRTLPTQAEKDKLSAAGVQLIDYIPNLAYTATLPQGFDPVRLKAFQVRSIIILTEAQKTVSALLQGKFPAHSVKKTGYADVTVITYEKLSAAAITKDLSAIKATILEDMPMFRTFTIRVPQKNIKKLINLPFVQWVEPIDAPNVLENLLGRSLHRVNVLNDGLRNLKGDGINVGIWDGGEVSPHLDFSPVASRLILKETSQAESHSTHVAGTIAGRGIINPKARGMAPNATLYSYNFNGNIQSEMATAIPALDLAVSSHSYGSTQTCGVTGAGVAYSSTSRSTDLNLNTYPSHLHVHSAGNSQSACSGGWSTITGSGKSAKNNILVANITTTETMSGSSSFGPVHDGRVKPEISSLGTNVISTYTPLNTYGTISGTSMATPGVSGTVALLVQRYKQLNSNTAPISSLIKAVTCNTAQDLGNPGPDYKFGFGRLNALAAVKALEQNRYVVNTITTGAANNTTITIPPGANRLKVMLTWNDPAGTANSSQALVNNLDLSVINGNTTSLPWILNPNSPATNATQGIDNVSNIEQVTVNNPVAGTYTLKVNGTAVPSGANQQYSLTWEIDQPFIEVIYPNGNETFSPNSSETITWDNSGITSNQTIEYSVNNGLTWSIISSTISPATTRFSWSVPGGLNTSTALIRVSSGTLTDVSDATFKILGTPLSLAANAGLCPGSLTFSWPAVTNATHYDLFTLDQTTGLWTVLASNISGTTYTASGLTPNASMWFTISAKNNTTGAESEKALAINRTVSNTAPVSLGTISGQSNICGTQNVTYAVQPATGVSSYTWSLPTGVSIVSGQGTNSIVASFAAGSLGGTVAVTGTIGSCQTSTSNMSVSVTPIAISTNGATTFCEGNTVTLTATPGSSYVWNNGETSQTITVSKSGQYAVTITNSNGCAATTLPTAVTVNPKPEVTVSAAPYTSLYPGLTTTLTAATKQTDPVTYSWMKDGEILAGATTNKLTVTVDELGTYKAIATNLNGCTGTSAILSIRDSVSNQTFIYPNPNNGQFQIRYQNKEGEVTNNTVIVYDAKGAEVLINSYSLKTAYTKMEVDLRRQTKGLYYVLLTDGNGKKLASGKVFVN